MKTLIWPFRMLGKGLLFLVRGKVLNTKTGALFADKASYREYLHPRNRGLVLDGDEARLSEIDSFQNVCVMARIGAGKTSRYVIPNVLNQAKRNCSLLVNDPKGEVFEQTSGIMQRNGFRVIVIDPENLDRSSRFNPLLEARNDIELEQMAEILVRSGIQSNQGKDDFWLQGAIRFASLFLKCLKIAGQEAPAYYSLHNLNLLAQNFGTDGKKLDAFIAKYTVDPNNPHDETLWNEWQGLLTGNEEGIASFVLNLITALKSLSNQNVAKLTSKSDFDLASIREQKTIIYLVTPAQHAEYYSFLTSLFFRSAFNACMRKLPDKKSLPVYMLMDEFGNITIPGFVSTANTIRGYRVSLSIILQSISQLNARYGKDYANSIQGGFATYLAYSGADPETAKFFEAIIGRVRERQRKDFDEHMDNYREYNLLNTNEIRTISNDEALVVSANRQPVLLKTTPYFKHWRYRRFARIAPCETPARSEDDVLKFVSLEADDA